VPKKTPSCVWCKYGRKGGDSAQKICGAGFGPVHGSILGAKNRHFGFVIKY
jgi:rhodanese-related sulfurtransferase